MPAQIGVYQGRIPFSPTVIQRGQDDLVNAPLTCLQYSARVHDVQLSNGIRETDMGRRMAQPAAGYLIASIPKMPGQVRLPGTEASFPTNGLSPSQWNTHVQNSAGGQPQYPGGPGQILGQIYNPGTG